jgi:hypothetical protein
MSRSTGTWSASLWPPLKLYSGKPLHLAAGAGNPLVKSGAKSNDAMDAVSMMCSRDT